MSAFALVQEALKTVSAHRIPKLTQEQRKEIEGVISQFMQSKGITSPSELMRGLKKDKNLTTEFSAVVGAKAKELGIISDEKQGLGIGKSVLRHMVADERRQVKLLNLTGGNVAFLKNADAARTLFAELKSETGETNTFKFLLKYQTDAGFHKRVNSLIEEKVKNANFSMFAGMKPEEVLKGISAVHVSTMTKKEIAAEILPVAGKEALKNSALSLGTTAAGLMQQMGLMVTSAIVGQIPGGSQAAWMAYYTAKESGGVFSSMYSNLAKTVGSNTSEQMRITTLEQLVKNMTTPEAKH